MTQRCRLPQAQSFGGFRDIVHAQDLDALRDPGQRHGEGAGRAVARFLGVGFATGLCVVIHVTAFFAKVTVMLWLMLLVRWSLPRPRYDQLMNLCWKLVLPLALANGLLSAAWLLALGGA